MAFSLIAVAGAAFLVFVVVPLIAAVVVLSVRRPVAQSKNWVTREMDASPLDRAKAAALELTTDEWVQFRLWVEGPRTPPASHGEGVMQ